jgi:prepilin-type N-terminal cleavage/methylation domain-containing protein
MKKGFTLVEMIVTLVLIGILTMVIAVYIREGFAAWSFLSGQKNIALSARAGLTQINRELKNVNSISVCTSTEVRFIDTSTMDIRYYQSGNNLMRNSDILLRNVEYPGGVAFSYYDHTGNVTTTAADVRLIRYRIVVTKGENHLVMESASAIRVKRLQ